VDSKGRRFTRRRGDAEGVSVESATLYHLLI
jgi:hypothetical protein